MNHRFLKKDAAPYSSEEEFQGIHSRIRRPMEALMPDKMLQAIQDLYLYFFSMHRHWIECLLELKRSSSGTLKYSATFSLSRNR